MRLRAFLPAYLLLALAVAYALGSLWTGLDRLDAIERYTSASDQSGQAVAQLQSLLTTALDLEVGGRGYVLTGDEAYLEAFERARKRAPDLLAELRGTVRDQPVKLAQVEQLVPLLAEQISATNSAIERRRAGGPTAVAAAERRDHEIFERIRDTLVESLAGERVELAHHRDTVLAAQRTAKRDAFIQAGFMLALVAALLLALRRIHDFVHPRSSGAVRQDSEFDTPFSHHAALEMLLRDAQMRVQVATTGAAGSDTTVQAHLKSLQRTLERALTEHAEVGADSDHRELGAPGLPEALGRLAIRYSQANRLMVNAIVDSAAQVATPQSAYLVCRSAEWALEVIAQRKRTGEVRLDCAREGDGIALRVSALADDPARAIQLTPREQESAGVLRSAIAGRAGTFELAEGPTGLTVSVKLPDTER